MGERLSVSGDDGRIVLDFPTLAEALQLWKPWGGGKKREEITELLHQALHSAGLCLEVRVQGKAVALLGGAAKSGLALQLLGGIAQASVSHGEAG